MVSFMNSESLKFYINNDSYPYSSLFSYPTNHNLLECPWGLISPKNYYASQKKKRKKLNENLGIEKSVKEQTNALDHTKSEIIEWIKSLPNEKRYDTFSIENAWLAIVFIKMYQKYQSQSDVVFALLIDDSKKVKDKKNIFDFGELENHFYCRKQQRLNELNGQFDKRQALIKAEQELIQSIRICDHNEFYDTLVFDEKFLENTERLLEIFDLVSDGHVFCKPYKQTWDYHIKSNEAYDSTWWFNPNTFQTLGAWIVSSFEKILWVKYFDVKKNLAKYENTLIDQLESKITLSYKYNLLEYWKNLEKSKKKQLLSEIPKIIQSFENYNKKGLNTKDSSENLWNDSASKEENKQKLGYLYTIYKDPEGNCYCSNQVESVEAYYTSLLDEKNDEKFIDYILFSSLDQFGALTNLVGRRLSTKLKDLYSENIASELILNEESEKCGKKKLLKKKKAKKKKISTDITSASTTPQKGDHIALSSPIQVSMKKLSLDQTGILESNSLLNNQSNEQDQIMKTMLSNKQDMFMNIGTAEEIEMKTISSQEGMNIIKYHNNKEYCFKTDCEINIYCKSLINDIIENAIKMSHQNPCMNKTKPMINTITEKNTPENVNLIIKTKEDNKQQVVPITLDQISIEIIPNKLDEENREEKELTGKNTKKKRRSKRSTKQQDQLSTPNKKDQKLEKIDEQILVSRPNEAPIETIGPKETTFPVFTITKPEESEAHQSRKLIPEGCSRQELDIDFNFLDDFDKKVSRSKKRRMKRKIKMNMKNKSQAGDENTLTPGTPSEAFDSTNISLDPSKTNSIDISSFAKLSQTQTPKSQDTNKMQKSNESISSNKNESALKNLSNDEEDSQQYSNSKKLSDEDDESDDDNFEEDKCKLNEDKKTSNIKFVKMANNHIQRNTMNQLKIELNTNHEEDISVSIKKTNLEIFQEEFIEVKAKRKPKSFGNINLQSKQKKREIFQGKNKLENMLLATKEQENKKPEVNIMNKMNGTHSLNNLQNKISSGEKNSQKDLQSKSTESSDGVTDGIKNPILKPNHFSSNQSIAKPNSQSEKANKNIKANSSKAIITNNHHNKQKIILRPNSYLPKYNNQSIMKKNSQKQILNNNVGVKNNHDTYLSNPIQQKESTLIINKTDYGIIQDKIDIIIQSNKKCTNINREQASSVNNEIKISNPTSIEDKNINNENINESKINVITSDSSPIIISPRTETQNTSNTLSLTSSSLYIESLTTTKIKDSVEKFFLKKLETDIVSHVAKLTEESNKIMDYRITAFKRLEFVIAYCFPNSSIKAKLFGSCATGLALKTSDVDIAVTGFSIIDFSSVINILQLINERLQFFRWIKVIKPIYSATIPVLKIEINPSIRFDDITMMDDNFLIQDILDNHYIIDGLNLSILNPEDFLIRVDLSVEWWSYINPMSHLGFLTTEFVQDMLNSFPSLYAMTMIFKQSLQKRNLLNMYQGGISSYCLVLMIVAYFKKYGETNYPNDLINFLKFYGREFDPTTIGIALMNNDEPFFPLQKEGLPANNFTLFDSINIGKNLGSASYNINLILNELSQSLEKLNQFKLDLENIVKSLRSKGVNIDEINNIDDPEFKLFIDKNLIETILLQVSQNRNFFNIGWHITHGFTFIQSISGFRVNHEH